MSYCRKCGAYIPDGTKKCLSCGFDETESERASASQSQQTQQQDWRSSADENRKKKMEEARKWAEEEHRKFTEQQKAAPGQCGTQLTQFQRVMSVLSYIFALCVVPYIVCPDDSYVMYHARQGMHLFILELIAAVLGIVPLVGWIMKILVLVYCIFAAIDGIGNAREGRMRPLKSAAAVIEKLRKK